MKRTFAWLKAVMATIVVAECAWLIYDEHWPSSGSATTTVERALAQASPLPQLRMDSQVQQVGLSELALPILTKSIARITVPEPSTRVLFKQTQGSPEIQSRIDPGAPIRLRDPIVQVEVTRNVRSKLWIEVADQKGDFRIAEEVTQTDGTFTYKVDMSAEKPGAYQLTFKEGDDRDAATSFAEAEIWVPDFNLAVPRVTQVLNNALLGDGARGPTAAQTHSNVLGIYGGYLDVSGTFSNNVAPANTHLEFRLYKRDKNTPSLITRDPLNITTLGEPVTNSSTWSAKLRLPTNLGVGYNGRIVPVLVDTQGDQRHRFADANDQVDFVIKSESLNEVPPFELKVAADGVGKTPLTANEADSVFFAKTSTIHISGKVSVKQEFIQDSTVVVIEQLTAGTRRVGTFVFSDNSTPTDGAYEWSVPVSGLAPGTHRFYAVISQGGQTSQPSKNVTVNVMTGGLKIVDFSPANRMFGLGQMEATIYFDPSHPLNPVEAIKAANYSIEPSINDLAITGVEYSQVDNSVTIRTSDTTAEGALTFVIKSSIVDLAGNSVGLDGAERVPLKSVQGGVGIEIVRSRIAGVPAVQKGVTSTGPPVSFSEYTQPREVPEGFNPSDKVETRVARLYYFRDAHRVAQIINRKTRSYNRQAVDMAQQMADQARSDADDATTSRRTAEQQAIEAARKTRQAEQRLADLQQELTQVARDAQVNQLEVDRLSADLNLENQQETPNTSKVESLKSQLAAAQGNAKASQDVVNSLGSQFENAQASVQNLRDEEVRTSQSLLLANEKEEKLRAEQFRREAAAAHADPDTYAPGEPESNDPVEQVSVSVIGEGVIQLRGPIKGINIVRKMINEIDSPVGQVRIAIHTFQVNGENANRMERSIGDIQRSIDQSRFLTLQSAEMLRKAVAQVAAVRATEVHGEFQAQSQAERDIRYLDSFFGADFVNELRTLDSEFLHTGNKILSLNSMDSTSLANALFIMALAKNSTRQEILQTFDTMLQCELTRAEESYLQSSFSCKQCDCKDWFHDRCCKECYCPLAGNARFESLRGFFNGELAGDDTLTPIQREFIRLAQIFKARLVTEMEYRQRVIERAVIEERIGAGTQQYLDSLRDARDKELKAKLDASAAQRLQRQQQAELSNQYLQLVTFLKVIKREVDLLPEELEILNESLKEKEAEQRAITSEKTTAQDESTGRVTEPLLKQQYFEFLQEEGRTSESQASADDKSAFLESAMAQNTKEIREQTTKWDQQVDAIVKELEKYKYTGSARDAFFALKYRNDRGDRAKEIRNLRYLVEVVTTTANELEKKILTLQANAYQIDPSNAERQYQDFLDIRSVVVGYFFDENKKNEIKTGFDNLNAAFLKYFEALRTARVAQEEAELARRPLDHKKFLDMLVDDLEDKYIELLEGTRAHTANIDNYIKRLATALEDDFNTQFYFPTFRMVRQAGRYRDVTFGQIETTSILTNNRELGKVTPQATMEFDLPKRDILITEAMKGAKAAVDEYGALLNDPTFLSLAKMGSGMPTSSQLGGASAGFSSVRNVLPGLDSSTQEAILSQSGPGDTQIGSAFESLIPDPAIYKFETGTGFEIRPVMQPDGQAVVFDFNYMYTTNVREPVRADEKHLGRVKRHYIDTDVQLSNYELREISRYQVQLKASRTSRGVPLFEDIPVVGALFRPLPQQESSLQQNLILGQTVIYPTLFDLMGLRWAPAVADLDPLRLSNEEFLVRGRHRALENRVYDHASSRVDDFLRVPEAMRRQDLYRTQETIPMRHPNGYYGSGLDRTTSELQEGYQPDRSNREQEFYPGASPEGNPYRLPDPQIPDGEYIEPYPLQSQQEGYRDMREELLRAPSSTELVPELRGAQGE